MSLEKYPPIGDYALISDCHSNALVSRSGSVDWCCMPRVDDDACFGRLLDWDKGGYWSIAPADKDFTTSRRYIDGTMIVETCFKTRSGEVRLTDFFVIGVEIAPHQRYQHIRTIDGLSGEMDVQIDIVPRFDYGEIVPRIQARGPGVYSAIGSNQGLIFRTDRLLQVVNHANLAATWKIKAGQRVRLAMQFQFPELIEESVKQGAGQDADFDRYFDRTRQWWAEWASRMRAPCELDHQTRRSTIVLKALTFEKTGAIIAASTTSLPEWVGAERNWDYRFSWVRDSVFSIRVLHELGYVREADRFHQFIQRSSAGDAEQLQIMYGVDGKRRLTEVELHWLEGYRQSRPVRIGNAAAKQAQLDIYGELLEMAWEWHESGHATDPDYWDFLADVVNNACKRWHQADHGIWEVRGAPQHYVHSKAMCWAALDCGIRLANANRFDAPVEYWVETREQIREAIEQRGYDAKRGVFVQAFGSSEMDAALLILPRVGFVSYDDPRMLRTAQAVCRDLDRGGLLLRYRGLDALRSPEGMFLPCTFWAVACLARQDCLGPAQAYYDRAISCANDLGLFSEEYDIEKREMLGNFPQGLTHESQIAAWLALTAAKRQAPGEGKRDC